MYTIFKTVPESLHVGVSRPFVNGSVQYGVAVMCMYVCVWTCAACIRV